MTPPPAINPTGEEISSAPVVMALMSSMPLTVIGRQAQSTMLVVPDEGQDFGDRGVLVRHRLHRVQSLGEDAGPVKQFLIKRPHGCEPRAGELAPAHADDVEPFQSGVLAVDEA